MVSESQFMMVSDWMENGNINEFIEKHPDADRLGLVSPFCDLVFQKSLTTRNPLADRGR